MSEPIQRPNWLPKNRLLYGLQRFGVRGAAVALEARIQEHGGAVSEETVVQRGQRLKRAQEFSAEAEQFASSERGVQAAKAAVGNLVQKLAQHAEELKKTGLNFESRHFSMGYEAVRSPNAVLVFRWDCHYANSLNDAKLHVSFYDKFPNLPGIMVFDDPRTLETLRFEFKLTGPNQPAWVQNETKVAPNDMADYLMKRLMHHNEMELRRQAKRG